MVAVFPMPRFYHRPSGRIGSARGLGRLQGFSRAGFIGAAAGARGIPPNRAQPDSGQMLSGDTQATRPFRCRLSEMRKLLLMVPLAGCEAAQGDRCAKSQDCGSGLVCFHTCVLPEDLAGAASRASDCCKELRH